MYEFGKCVKDSKAHSSFEQLTKSKKQFKEYTGTFGNYAYGNMTFYIDRESKNLFMRYGISEVAYVWDLGDSAIGDMFSAQGMDIFWYDTKTAIFNRDDDDEIASVLVTLDPLAPPTFVSDIDWNDPPPPPEMCP